MGNALLSEECPPELAWILCWKKRESLESYSLIAILDHMEGEKKVRA